MAAALPRHGPRRLPRHPDDQRVSSSCRPPRRTSSPNPATGCSGSPTAAARPPPGRTSRGCWRPGRSGGCSGLDLSTLTLALSGRRAGRPGRGRGVRRRGRAVRVPPGRRVPGVRHGRGGHRRRRSRRRAAGMVCDIVDRVVLERDRVAKPIDIGDPDELERQRPAPAAARHGRCPAWRCASSIPTRTRTLPERHVGELLLRGTSVTPGYYKRPDATAALFHDGWLCTGDLAYLLDGELVLCGRIKDVIIVGGRNVFPEDIERAVGALDGVRAGNVIAFGMEGYKGKESVVVVAEVAHRRSRTAVRDAIHHRTLEVCGLPPRDVMLVQPGTLPKTSRGKLQRAKCREQYLDGGARAGAGDLDEQLSELGRSIAGDHVVGVDLGIAPLRRRLGAIGRHPRRRRRRACPRLGSRLDVRQSERALLERLRQAYRLGEAAHRVGDATQLAATPLRPDRRSHVPAGGTSQSSPRPISIGPFAPARRTPTRRPTARRRRGRRARGCGRGCVRRHR